MAADGQRYVRPDAPICEARASACVSMYSRMFVSLPSLTVMAKIQSSSNVLFVALIFPLAKPTTRTRSPCATNSRGSVDVSIDLDAVSSKSTNPACPRSLPVAAADRGEEVLHGLDVLLSTHGNFSISCIVALPVGRSCSSVEL